MKSKIGELRRKNGLTQQYVASKINVSYQRLSEWEHDKGMPKYDKAYELAKIFNVSMEELYERK
ncbi:helix-turn-helix transcriptional regulator [Ornithinibacillus xuwenensis]|uniref:Helix-turn-helix transcriptional regulator n=1 Tax=Ornithinibacillus xuwenensis TaxID=3144668 RepID=A0ABU9XBZ6_9BACI